MGDFVSKEEVEKIRAHYEAYKRDVVRQKDDNRAVPVSGVYDASTFREVSTWYINRLLRYIDVEDLIHEIDNNGST